MANEDELLVLKGRLCWFKRHGYDLECTVIALRAEGYNVTEKELKKDWVKLH